MRTLPFVIVAAGLGLASSAMAMKPGLWEINTQMSGAGVPAMPKISDAERKQMESMGIKLPQAAGGGVGMSARHCVTKEQAEQRQPPMSDEDKRQRCEQKDVKHSGNTVSWKIECTGEHKMTGTGSVTYQGEESYTGESTFTTKEPGQGPTTMKQSYTGKWLSSDCKGAGAPR